LIIIKLVKIYPQIEMVVIIRPMFFIIAFGRNLPAGWAEVG
jgi:hypothetical protein